MRRFLTLLAIAFAPVLAQISETPRHLLGVSEPLTAASSAAPEEIANQHLRGLARELSLSSADLDSIYIARRYRSAHNGVTHIVFRQRFQNADVLNAEWVVNIDADGRVLNAGGNLFSAPSSEAMLPERTRARTAVRTAVAAVNPALKERFVPFESAEAPRARQGIRFSRGPLASDVEGAAGWYAVRGQLRPVWNFYIADMDRVHSYAVTVDDGTQAILRQQPLTFFQSAPRGLVFDQESPQPNPTPGVRLTAAPPLAPRVMKSFQGDPAASPTGWSNGTETAGNNVIAGENLAGTGFIRPTPAQAANGDFSFPLQLGAGFNPLDYGAAATANLFYWMNRAHDLHYRYGFDEQSGNFQMDNFGRGGVGGDPVFAYAHYGAQSVGFGQFENAFFSLSGGADDGSQPEVAMFISGGIGSLGDLFTDGSYDSLVMVHEYTHGVSNRLARQVYTTFQGGAMGEAWSDFFGLEYTTADGAPADGVYPTGQYFDQSWGYGGARSRPYSTNTDINPITFADIGHVRGGPEVHADGEIWVEALWEVRANLIQQFGEQEGRQRVRQIVMDGMKLAVPAASMVDMRDAILLADRVDYKGASQNQIWAGFARRGLGALAYTDGANTVHVMASFDMPSNTGAIAFYDNPIVIGEAARIVLQDSNYTQPTVRIQLTGDSGDLENLVLRQRGSIYVGSINTGVGTVTRSDNRLELVPGDQINAYYVDQNTGTGAKLVTTTISTMLPYELTGTANAFSFSGETKMPSASSIRFTLPFSFPFFDKQYLTATVTRDGMIYFEPPLDMSPCGDYVSLRQYVGLSPLWLPFSLSGSAQPDEGLYTSSTSDSMTFRWAGEYTAAGQKPMPVNIAATLYNDGKIQFNYGAGNQDVLMPLNFNQCAPGATGISNGHNTYSQYTFLSNYENGLTLHFNPPYGNSTLPNANITTPKSGDHVQDVLTVSGTASDAASTVRSVDVFVDGVQRSRVVPAGSTLAWSVILNVNAMGLKTGDHQLSIRVTNGRGGFSDLPATPIPFTVDPGNAWMPIVALEQPADGDTVKGLLKVTGYAYNASLRITNVDTLIDGFVYGPTGYNMTRNDVCDPLPAPKPANCPAVGFSGIFNTLEGAPPIPDGPHKLQIRVRDQSGRFTFYPDAPITISVQNGAAAAIIGVLESPTPNQQLSGTITVTGYVYSPGRKIVSGLLLVDGSSYGSITLNQPRPDVCATLTNADACPNIGFRVTLNTNRLLNGPHILGIRAVNDRGDSVTFPRLVNGGINVSVQN